MAVSFRLTGFLYSLMSPRMNRDSVSLPPHSIIAPNLWACPTTGCGTWGRPRDDLAYEDTRNSYPYTGGRFVCRFWVQ